jgi:hypothetical protein
VPLRAADPDHLPAGPDHVAAGPDDVAALAQPHRPVAEPLRVPALRRALQPAATGLQIRVAAGRVIPPAVGVGKEASESVEIRDRVDWTQIEPLGRDADG